jgi:hypothetical protein
MKTASREKTNGWCHTEFISLTHPKAKNKPAIKFFAFASGKSTILAVEDGPVPSFGLAVSPDASSILFTRLVPGESRIMLMKNFR